MTIKEQNLLNKQQKDQLRAIKTAEKINVLGVYFGQADDIIDYIKSIPDDAWKSDIVDSLARMDIALDYYNADIYPSLLKANLELANLGADHVAEFSQYRVPKDIVTGEVASNIYDASTGFYLADSVWSDKKRIQLYKKVLDAQAQGLSQGEASELTDDYLKNSQTGGQYYNVERIVDNETQASYSDTYLSSMFESNRALIGLELYYERKLSPAHRIYDICDELAGVWSITDLVPGVPSHGNCACEANIILRGPAKGPLKEFRDPVVRYKGQEVELYKPEPKARKKKSIMPKSSNKWNAELEKITKTLTGADLTKGLKQLVDKIRNSGTQDPVALQLLTTIELMYGVS